MNIILLERVRNLGNLGDKVKVRQGYGRNFLIPQGKAVLADAENLKAFEAKRAQFESKAKQSLADAQALADQLNQKVFTLSARVADEGRLYGSVGTRDIQLCVNNAGFSIEKSAVQMPHGVLRQIGDYDITLQLHSDVAAVVRLQIVAE